ncbi:MAG: FAD-binding protein, partial [Candidatus Eremiobacteraeota bacterium]|nr:FAD-binding protein [Candidatus Eremiobacteraeota bacterium]
MKNRNPASEVLILGGGVAGMRAALDLGESGFHVHLAELSDEIGGL